MLLSPKAITLQHPCPIIRHHHTGSRPPGLAMSPSSNRRTIDIAKRCLLQQSSTAGKEKDKGRSVGIAAPQRVSISDIATPTACRATPSTSTSRKATPRHPEHTSIPSSSHTRQTSRNAIKDAARKRALLQPNMLECENNSAFAGSFF